MAHATGGCLCGAVRYEIDGKVGPAAICHCQDCRRMTGSAFSISVRVSRDNLRITSGETKQFVSLSESGSEITRCFCPACGSPIYGFRPQRPDTYFVKAGSLDDPSLVHPADQFWTDSAVGWAHIPPDLPAFEKGRT